MSRLHRWRGCLFVTTLATAISSVTIIGCKPQPASSEESWEILFMRGDRIGYVHTTVEPAEEAGRKLVKVVGDSKLTMLRYGEKIEQSLQITSLQTPAGELVRFATNTAFGPTPMQTTGRVDPASGKLMIETVGGGQTLKTSFDLPAGCRGLFEPTQSLRERPMLAGNERTFKAILPIMNQVVDIKLVARGKKPTKLLDGKMHELMCIECTTSSPDGNEMASTVWTDDSGVILKSSQPMQQETYRATKDLALAEIPTPKFDLGFDALVKIAPPLNRPHNTRRVRYKIEVEGGNPAKVFAHCPSQSIKQIDDHQAEVTVSAIRPNSPAKMPAGAVPPTEADGKPNALVQSDDPEIIALAEKAAPSSASPWQVAVALEKWVHDEVTKKNFSQAFASAAEVAKSREGDCTEHAVLLAALLRARGIPARVAIGLVYVEADEAFGLHMWTEAFVGDRWIPLDATLAKEGIGGAHLKLIDTNLDGADAYSSFLPVAQVLGRLKIKVLEVE